MFRNGTYDSHVDVGHVASLFDQFGYSRYGFDKYGLNYNGLVQPEGKHIVYTSVVFTSLPEFCNTKCL